MRANTNPTLALLLAFVTALVLGQLFGSTALAQQDDGAQPQPAEAEHEPGRLLSVESYRAFSVEQIAQEGGRFANNGQAPPTPGTGVALYIVSFSTTGPDGGPAVGNAQLFVPDAPAYDALLLFAPGSTGLTAYCGPLQELRRTGEPETYGATALAYAGQGLPTVLPDYLYVLGPDYLQPYFVATAEAAVLLDALRASHAALAELGLGLEVRTNFLAGYSQGGHAIFAAADRAATYTPDLEVGGVVGFGPSGELDVLFRNFHYTAPWVVWSYVNTYPDAGMTAAQVLAPAYAERLERDVREQCVAEAQNSYPVEPQTIYTDEFWTALTTGSLEQEFPAWHEAFEANDTALSGHGIPVYVHQGVDDPIVPIQDQTAFVARLCQQGSPVRYANYLRTRHETRYVGFDQTLVWIRGLLDGEDPPSDCLEVLD